MKTDSTPSPNVGSDADDAFGRRAMLFVGCELDPQERASFDQLLSEDDRKLVGQLTAMDTMLRDFAAEEGPPVAELRRTREMAMRLARTRAIPLIQRSATQRGPRGGRLPRWSLAAAAAILAIVGFVSWISNVGPSGLPSSGLNAGTAGMVEGRPNFSQMWETDAETYTGLLNAFTPVEPSTGDYWEASGIESQEDIDAQEAALTMLRAMSQE